MNLFRKLWRGDADIDFERIWPKCIAVSLLLVVISIISFATRGLNLGIDFEGGGVWEVPDESSSVADVRDALRAVDQEGATIQVVEGSSGRRIRVQSEIAELGPEAEAVTQVLAEQAGVEPNEVSVTTVGPSWGEEITKQTRTALIWFFVIIAAYIAWRLEWKMAVGALVAVVHDIIISVGVYSILNLEVTPATAISFLTIMGYSLYDTIVVFDRARENEARRLRRGGLTYSRLMSTSLNQTLMRSLNTTFSSVLPVISMLVVGSLLLGAATLQEFAVALMVGTVVGGYSSPFIAAPVVVLLKEREPRYREIRARARDDKAKFVRAEPADDPASDEAEDTGGEGEPEAPARKRAPKRPAAKVGPSSPGDADPADESGPIKARARKQRRRR